MSALEDAQNEFCELFALDVAEYGSAYKQAIRNAPTIWALRILAGCDEREVRNMIANLKAERRKVTSRPSAQQRIHGDVARRASAP